MAKFCTKCGSPLQEGMKFCTGCGASASEPTAPPERPTPGPATAAPSPATPPPAKKASPVLKIVLIVVAFFVVISVIGAAAGIYLVYKAKQKVESMVESAKTTSGGAGTPEIHLGKGGEGSAAAANATTDVPPYPGSTPTEAGGALSLGGLGAMSGQDFETPDPVEKVVAFYKEKFGSRISIEQKEGSSTFTLRVGTAVTTVNITREEGDQKTRIAISRIGK